MPYTERGALRGSWVFLKYCPLVVFEEAEALRSESSCGQSVVQLDLDPRPGGFQNS